MVTRTQSLTVPTVDKSKQDCHCGCSPCDGTCCRLDCIVQPRFFCGQLLTDADLSALLKWARDRFGLSRYRHCWGVVCGLDVRGKYNSLTTVIVTPGYAVDCCGNDIIICQDEPIDLKKYCRDEEDPCANLRTRLIAVNGPEELEDRLRAIDIYLQYNEESADPTTAMGRGSCKQVSSCEYSRTKETYKLVPEVGVVGTDPVAARAQRWREEYEKCLDVLKNFRPLVQGGVAGRARAEWLLRWFDEHPEFGLASVRKPLADKYSSALQADDFEFFETEVNLVAIVFALVQACRNAYLNCECFGCDEDVRLPLARVWMLAEDRRTNQECRVVAIDAYPPYRRPIQPECSPAPLGSVNVGRFIWRRWDEVCPALNELGLNIERRTFELPPTLRELEDALSCDLFVRCNEQRFAYVLNAKIPGLNADIFGDRVIGFCTTPPGPPQCPALKIDGPVMVASGQPITFAVTLSPDPGIPDLMFSWKVSEGTITSGQGTSRITVDTTNVVNAVDAIVVIDGLDPTCPKSAEATTKVSQPQDDPVADFTLIPQIGASRAAMLQAAGIRSFKNLALTPLEKLKQLFAADIGATEDVLKGWIQEAKNRAGQ
jgi:hypothetical protein